METWILGVPFKTELSPSAEDKGKTRSVFRLHNRDNGVGAVHQKSPLPGQREPGRADRSGTAGSAGDAGTGLGGSLAILS